MASFSPLQEKAFQELVSLKRNGSTEKVKDGKKEKGTTDGVSSFRRQGKKRRVSISLSSSF